MHNKIRTVIFDCDGVMWKPVDNQIEILSNELEIGDTTVLQKEFIRMFEQFNIQFESRKVTINAVYNLIGREMPILKLYNKTPKDFMKKFWEIAIETSIVNQHIHILMDYLQQESYKIIVKTDWWEEWQIRKMKAFEILKYVETVYGCDKAYLKRNPLSAKGTIIPGRQDEYVIIGDNLTEDICFAQNSGIQSIWFNEGYKKTNNTKFKPTYEVDTLIKIMQIL